MGSGYVPAVIAHELDVGSGEPQPRVLAQDQDRRDSGQSVRGDETQGAHLFQALSLVLLQSLRRDRAGKVVFFKKAYIDVVIYG